MAKHKEKKSPSKHKKNRGMEIEVEVEMHKDKKKKESPKKKGKIAKVMHEFKEHELHSGSKEGPVVRNPKQALAIAMSEARKYGSAEEMPKPRKKRK